METHVVSIIWKYLPVLSSQLERIAEALERIAIRVDGKEPYRELADENYVEQE